MANELEPRLFNVDEYYRLPEVGILREDAHVELIDGIIVKMAKVSSRHAACTSRLNRVVYASLPSDTVIVSPRNPVRLNLYSEPVPDVALLKPHTDFYSSAHPGPADVLLLIEVADTTQNTDRSIKGLLYARNNIVEYWLVNFSGETIEVYTDPVDGQYNRFLWRGAAML